MLTHDKTALIRYPKPVNHPGKGNPMNQNLQQDWISSAEAAEIMELTQRMVAYLCTEKRIRCMKIGNSWAVWREDAENYQKTGTGRPRNEESNEDNGIDTAL